MPRTVTQSRSVETRERILVATEALLREKTFDALSVQEIARRARSSVGSLYHQFGDKDALLPELYRRHCHDVIAGVDAFVTEERASDSTLSELVTKIVGRFVDLHRRQHGLLRALVLRAHAAPAERANERPDAMEQILPRLADLVATRRSEIAHPNPRAAARIGILVLLATLRERLLFPMTSARSLGIPERSLARELRRVLLSYLTAELPE